MLLGALIARRRVVGGGSGGGLGANKGQGKVKSDGGCSGDSRNFFQNVP